MKTISIEIFTDDGDYVAAVKGWQNHHVSGCGETEMEALMECATAIQACAYVDMEDGEFEI